MADRRDILDALAANRSRRLTSDGRFEVPLTDAEVASSTRMAMRLADASASEVELPQAASLPATA